MHPIMLVSMAEESDETGARLLLLSHFRNHVLDCVWLRTTSRICFGGRI